MNIFFENLSNCLKRKLYSFYILQGKEIILCQDSEELIIYYAKKNGFYEKKYFNPNNLLEWEKIFLFASNKNIFLEKIILIINLNDHELKNNFYKNINILLNLMNNKILLIVKLNQDFYIKQQNILLKKKNIVGIIVNCTLINKINLKQWFRKKTDQKKIKVNKKIEKILYTYYENNLLSLSKILDVLSLIYFNSEVQVNEIYNIIADEGIFNAFQWSKSVLNGDGKKAIRILKKFHNNNYEPIILIRVLQKSILKIIKKPHILKNFSSKTNQQKLLINNTNYIFILYKMIKILSKLEINIKNNQNYSTWIQLKVLSLALI